VIKSNQKTVLITFGHHFGKEKGETDGSSLVDVSKSENINQRKGSRAWTKSLILNPEGISIEREGEETYLAKGRNT